MVSRFFYLPPLHASQRPVRTEANFSNHTPPPLHGPLFAYEQKGWRGTQCSRAGRDGSARKLPTAVSQPPPLFFFFVLSLSFFFVCVCALGNKGASVETAMSVCVCLCVCVGAVSRGAVKCPASCTELSFRNTLQKKRVFTRHFLSTMLSYLVLWFFELNKAPCQLFEVVLFSLSLSRSVGRLELSVAVSLRQGGNWPRASHGIGGPCNRVSPQHRETCIYR